MPGIVFAVIFNDLMATLATSNQTITWMVAICAFITNIVGPVTASFTQWYSCRSAAIVGGILMAIGMSCVYWSQNIIVFFIMLGIFVGVGTSFAVNSSLFIVNEYFDKIRAVAMGIRLTGYPLGRMVLIPLCQLILDEFNYKAVALIMTAVLLNICVCGALFQPLKLHMKVVSVPVYQIEMKDIKHGEDEKLQDFNGEEKRDQDLQPVVIITENRKPRVRPSLGRRVFNAFFGGLNFSLLKDPMFYAAFITGLANTVLITYSHVYLFPYCIQKQLSHMQSAGVSSAGAFADMAGRLVLPFFMMIPKVGGKKGCIVFTTVSGLAIIAIIFSSSFLMLCFWNSCLGFAIGGQICSVFVIAAEIFGSPMVPTVIGLSQFLHGIVVLSLGPLLGMSNDVTGSYNMSYYVMAAQQFATAGMWTIILICAKAKRNTSTSSK